MISFPILNVRFSGSGHRVLNGTFKVLKNRDFISVVNRETNSNCEVFGEV